jgi:hypothetical protein
MNTITYGIVSGYELTEQALNIMPAHVRPGPYDDEYAHYVFMFENDVPVAFVGQDGGEPEDQTLTRDFSWVLGALQDAHTLGLALGKVSQS